MINRIGTTLYDITKIKGRIDLLFLPFLLTLFGLFLFFSGISNLFIKNKYTLEKYKIKEIKSINTDVETNKIEYVIIINYNNKDINLKINTSLILNRLDDIYLYVDNNNIDNLPIYDIFDLPSYSFILLGILLIGFAYIYYKLTSNVSDDAAFAFGAFNIIDSII
jgi:hypothetical protein